MKTNPLIQEYPEIYQNFMINKDRAISIPILQSRTGYLSSQDNWIQIREAKNNRIYIAFQKNTQNTKNLTFFDQKKKTRKKIQIKKQKFNNKNISFLIEEEWSGISYQEEILKLANKLEEYLINNKNIWNIGDYLRGIHRENFSWLQNLRIQDQINCWLIHKNQYENFTNEIGSAKGWLENTQRIQLYHPQNKKIKNTNDQTDFIRTKTFLNQQYKKLLPAQKPKFYETENIQQKKEEWANYISHKILVWILFDQNPRIEHILTEEKTIKKIPKYCNIFQHDTHHFSILFPKEMSIAAKEELLETIKTANPHCFIKTKIDHPFQTQSGIRRELNNANGIVRSTLKWKTYLLKDKDGTTTAGDKDYLLKWQSYDILIDKTQNKLYIAGNKTNAKEIHSQTMTNEILLKLIQDDWWEIDNRTLSRSSYSKNKNNMLWKIILPLKKAVKKHCDKDIKISCTGQLNNFIIKKEPDDINIWRITTIFEEMKVQTH